MSKTIEEINNAVVDPQEVERYMVLPYHIILRPASENKGGGWLAWIAEFDGSMTQGKTKAEALADLEIVQHNWIDIQLAMGEEVPLPMISPVLVEGKTA